MLLRSLIHLLRFLGETVGGEGEGGKEVGEGGEGDVKGEEIRKWVGEDGHRREQVR